jgi:hypothetical protein
MSEPGLSVAELDRLLKTADPGALLLPTRLLRRVIKYDCHLRGLGLQVPHRKSYVCARDRLLSYVEPAEMGIGPGSDLPETLLLMAAPDDTPDGLPRGATLLKYWRLLFHARVHLALEQLGERLTGTALRQRIERFSPAEFDEVRFVLGQERYLLPPADEHSVWIEFAAVYLEIRHFTPVAVSQVFPGIAAPQEVDALLAEDLDVPALLAATRPEGAPDPLAPPAPAPAIAAPGPVATDLVPSADRAAAVGNVVRCAILRARAGDQGGAEAALAHLTQRLQVALQLHRAEAESWRQLLPALLPPATRGIWPVAARLLYDLQKVCLNHERTVYKLDLVEWALSLGRRPIKRPLPGQQEVLTLRYLRSALVRLPSSGLGDAQRRQFAGLLQAAIHHSEAHLRDRFRPVLLGALEDVGLRPATLPERVARQKLVEELLDRIVERGFINLGDIRDALSRNQLKLPDLAGPGEFFRGDALLRLDHVLAEEMEGPYARGEFYLRWLQRFSAMSFGTRVGRFLTRYVVLPFGGAFVILEGLQHVVEPLAKLVMRAPAAPPNPDELPPGWQDAPAAEVPEEIKDSAHTGIHLLNWYSFLILGFVLLGLLHVPAFRARVLHGLRTIGRGLKMLCYDLPASVIHLPWMQRILNSRVVAKLWDFGLKPMLLAVAGALLILEPLFLLWPPILGPAPWLGRALDVWLGCVIVLYPLAVLLLHTRLGREVEERLTDHVERTWQQLVYGFIPGVFYLIVDVFRMGVEALDRLIYAVDERLRFRTGDSRLALYVKPVVGLLWSAIAYVLRFCVNLLIEPQINPIKHFPVVTVSHKLVLTLGVPIMSQVLQTVFSMRDVDAVAMSVTIGSLIPGIFGFLVWEFKENWKLYRANRAPALRPAVVGSHGETVARLLRPGFHSGTVPKLFAKLRKAARRARRSGSWVSFRKQRDALNHVEECVHHFVERELLRLLAESKSWGGLRVYTGAVVLCTNRIRVELHCTELAPEAVWLTFTEYDDVLEVRADGPGWLTHLSAEQLRTLTVALAGLYKLAGVDRLDEAPAGAERNGQAGPPFSAVVIPWEQWVQTWEDDLAGKGLPKGFAGGAALLPPVARAEIPQEV